MLEWTTKCFSTLGIIRVNQQLLVERGAVRAVVRAMKKQQLLSASKIILCSLRALYALLGSPEGGDAAANEGTSRLLHDLIYHNHSTKDNGEICALAREELKMVEAFKFTMLEERANELEEKMDVLGDDLNELNGVLEVERGEMGEMGEVGEVGEVGEMGEVGEVGEVERLEDRKEEEEDEEEEKFVFVGEDRGE